MRSSSIVDAGVGVDAGVVAVEVGVGLGGEPGEVGVGDDEPVLGDATGQVGVGGFAVEAVDADGDRQVPGAALGAVGGEGVAVADLAAAGEVAVVQHDVDVGGPVEPHDEPSPVDGGDGAELPVGDVDERRRRRCVRRGCCVAA